MKWHMKYDHNNILGLFKFQSGYKKIYLNSPKGYSWKIINAQTVSDTYKHGKNTSFHANVEFAMQPNSRNNTKIMFLRINPDLQYCIIYTYYVWTVEYEAVVFSSS